MHEEQSAKWLVLGAGAAGLAAAKNFQDAGIAFEVIERSDDVGGLWDVAKPWSSAYSGTRFISSKPLTQFPDFPMPVDYPDYPDQAQGLAYLRAYARHFGLYEHIRFDTIVSELTPLGADHGWMATTSGGGERHYAGVVIASGHLWDRRYPDYPGTFEGLALHSGELKDLDRLGGRRVLIVGGGNSGCDIAVASSGSAAQTYHSLRRGYHFIPKYIFGRPADQLDQVSRTLRLPLFLRRVINLALIRLVSGSLEPWGLPRPDHRLFESHPVVNGEIGAAIRRGHIRVKPDVAELCGQSVRFVDGSIEPIDVIVFATGFKISFPFLDERHLQWGLGGPRLPLHLFHPDFENLFFAGLIQPDSGVWWLTDLQMKLVARIIRSRPRHSGALGGQWRKRMEEWGEKDWRGGIAYVDSARHFLEVDHARYARFLRRIIRSLA